MTGDYSDGENLTKEELLFLHLLDHNDCRGHYIVTVSITEQGIRNALDCDLSLISRIIKRNEEKGHIFRTLSKVENKKRKQNAFFLTDEGLSLAEELQKKYPDFELKKGKGCVIQKCLKEF